MAEFQVRGPALAKMSGADFRQAIAIGPTPTDQCCRDAKAFVTQASALSRVECIYAAEQALLYISMRWTTRGSPSLQHGRLNTLMILPQMRSPYWSAGALA